MSVCAGKQKEFQIDIRLRGQPFSDFGYSSVRKDAIDFRAFIICPYARMGSAAEILRAAIGLPDVDALIATLTSLQRDDVRPYLIAMLDSPAAAEAVALAVEAEGGVGGAAGSARAFGPVG